MSRYNLIAANQKSDIMKILVTGGSGFIGSVLVRKLLGAGHEVVVLDLTKGSEAAQYLIGDIRNMDEVQKAAKGCGLVFHLAAIIDVRASAENDYAINFLGARNVFEAARRNNAKIVFTSSAAVYGDAPLPVSESSDCNPLSQYGKSKLKAEKLLGENDLILRLFNVYGPGAKSVVNKFCKKVPASQQITVYGTGMQTRDYVYVDDVVSALLLGFRHSGLYNVGTGVETKLLDVIDIIHRLSDIEPNIKSEPPNDKEIKRSVADISKIKSLGWSPKVSAEEGIRRILEK